MSDVCLCLLIFYQHTFSVCLYLCLSSSLSSVRRVSVVALPFFGYLACSQSISPPASQREREARTYRGTKIYKKTGFGFRRKKYKVFLSIFPGLITVSLSLLKCLVFFLEVSFIKISGFEIQFFFHIHT